MFVNGVFPQTKRATSPNRADRVPLKAEAPLVAVAMLTDEDVEPVATVEMVDE